MPYPDNCIRGISDPNYLCEHEGRKFPHRGLFTFQNNPERTDGCDEGSINWMDDEGARDFTLSQTKDDDDGEPQFKVGIAILPRNTLDTAKKEYGPRTFNYERAPMPSNSYHGNLLLKSKTPKQLMDLIRSLLAMGVSEVILRDDSQLV